MPISALKAAEGPANVGTAQPTVDVPIVRHVFQVVEVDEIEIQHLAVDEQRDENQGQAQPQLQQRRGDAMLVSTGPHGHASVETGLCRGWSSPLRAVVRSPLL